MKVCTAHPADDIVEKETRGVSWLGYHAMPRRILAKLKPRWIFARLKKHDGEIFSQRANA